MGDGDIVYYCILLYTIVYYCILLYTIVYYCILLFKKWYLIHVGICNNGQQKGRGAICPAVLDSE